MNVAIILAAGKSTRFLSNEKKQFLMYKDKPLYLHSVDTFLSCDIIDKIVLVIDKNDEDNEAIKNYLNDKIYITYGGINRYDSVHNALLFIKKNLDIKENDHIFIHDSARPFVKDDDIKKLNEALKVYGVVSLATKTTDTIKSIELEEQINDIWFNKVSKTIDRQYLWNVLTPQGFRYGIIKDAYDKFYTCGTSKNITDDLQIIEYFTLENTYLIEGDKHNIKITTNEDMVYLNN